MKELIFEFIEKHSPIKRQALLNEINNRRYDDGYWFKMSDRLMRKIIEDMICQDNYCIASSEKGYSVITNEEQLNEARQYLKAKAYPLFERAKSLHRNFYKDKNIQLSFKEFIN